VKANQAFKANDEAVSPVIGVILMVAITVVLAAVVFVLVSNLSKTNDQAPQLTLSKADAGNGIGGTLTVISVSKTGLTWSSFAITGTATCSITDTTVDAGDVITCTADGAVRIAHTATNTLVYQGSF
jgi:archaeal type IV pilus assembly protein PilA